MPFRVKNLMINVLPEQLEAIQPPNFLSRWRCCHWFSPFPPTNCFYVLSCQVPSNICPTLTHICPVQTIECDNQTFVACKATSLPNCGITEFVDIDQSPIILEQAIQVASPEALMALQGQLARLQEAAKVQLQAVESHMAPQTIEEAEALEKHLTEALDEVRVNKEALRKQPRK